MNGFVHFCGAWMWGLNFETRLCSSILCYLLWNLPCFLTVTFWLDASSSKRDLKPSWFIWGFSLQRGLLKSLGKVFNLTVTGSCVSLALHCSMPAACMHWCIAVIKAEQISQACENELMGLSLHHLVMPAFPLGWGILTCLHIFFQVHTKCCLSCS